MGIVYETQSLWRNQLTKYVVTSKPLSEIEVTDYAAIVPIVGKLVFF